MVFRDRMSSDSQAGLQAWIVSCLFHALLLTLIIPFVQHLLRITPEPFHWTISLVEPFDAPSEKLSTPPLGADTPMVPLTSERRQPFVPPQPSASGSHESKRQLMAAVQAQASSLAEIVKPPISSKSHAVPESQLTSTSLPNRHSPPVPAQALQQHTSPHTEMARPEAPATRVEPSRPQYIATEQPIQHAGEAALHPPSHPSDQPIQTTTVASVTSSDVEMPAAPPPLVSAMSVAAASAVSVTRDNGEPPPIVAARVPSVLHGSSNAAEAPGPIQKDEASSAQTRPRSDYTWLQQALSRRLEELKRSVRPPIEESGHLRVLVRAVVSNTGELMEAEIVNSSGHHRIDQDAMTLVQRAFPISLDQDLDRPRIAMRIPITFSRD